MPKRGWHQFACECRASDKLAVVQRSDSSSTDPTKALINLTGTFFGGTIERNTIVCNSETEPGACCAGTSCPPGYDVWNNSGLDLPADDNAWIDGALGVCNCDS